MAKRGRPPLNGKTPKTKSVTFRFTGSEWCDLFQVADEDGKSMSQEIRDLVQRRLKEQEEEREDRRKKRAAWYAERGYPEPDN